MISIKSLARYCNFALFLMPLTTLMGWTTHAENLKLVFGLSKTAMNPLSAVCFLVLGVALFIARNDVRGLPKFTGPALAALPILISLLHASDVLPTSHLRLDQILFTDSLKGNVMPLHTSVGFFIAGLTVIFFRYRGVGALTVSPLLALGVGWLALLAITGYFYGADVLNRTTAYAPMALSTAVTFLFFAVSVLLSKATFEPTRTFVSPTAAGRIARLLIPLALVFPVFSGWMRMKGESYGIFDPKLAVTIFALINIAVWASAIWTTAHYLYRAEKRNQFLIDFLDKNAKTDVLSGLWNRRYLEERLEAATSAFNRHGRIFSCIITDIDHFKKVNDTYGHNVGDLVIKNVAEILARTARTEDVVCRFGGEEFVLLLPDTSAAEAALLAERLRTAVERSELLSDETSLRVTCSFGVAQAFKGGASVIERADANLYAAKQAGRNRVAGEMRMEPVAA